MNWFEYAEGMFLNLDRIQHIRFFRLKSDFTVYYMSDPSSETSFRINHEKARDLLKALTGMNGHALLDSQPALPASNG